MILPCSPVAPSRDGTSTWLGSSPSWIVKGSGGGYAGAGAVVRISVAGVAVLLAPIVAGFVHYKRERRDDNLVDLSGDVLPTSEGQDVRMASVSSGGGGGGHGDGVGGGVPRDAFARIDLARRRSDRRHGGLRLRGGVQGRRGPLAFRRASPASG